MPSSPYQSGSKREGRRRRKKKKDVKRINQQSLDFCKRAKDTGYQIKFYPGAQVMHRGAKSFSQLAVFDRKRAAGQSLIYYFKKNGNIFQVLAIGVVVPAVLAAAWFLGHLEKAFKFKVHPHV